MNRSRLMLGLLPLLIAAPTFAQTGQPVQQPWSGWAQCQITIQAPGYAHSETHQWKIAGGGTSRANQQFYPAAWTVIGSGSLQRVSGPTTVSAQWQVNGTLSTIEIGTTLHLDRITLQRWTGHGPARGALTGTEVSTTNGVPRSRFVVLDIQQWAFPTVEGATTGTRMTGSNTVPFDGLRGPMNPPSGAMGTAACTWDFARGTSQASQPPTVSAQPAPTPASGGAVSGGAPSGGGGATAGGAGSSSGAGGAVAGGAASGGSTSGGAAGGPPGAATGGGSTGTGGSGSADLASGVNLRATPPYAAPANGKIVYDIAIWNSGPSAANGAMLRVSPSAGPSNWSNFVCFTSQGPAPVPCPSGIAAGTIQSGLAIPGIPPNSGFKVWFDAAVPGTVGSNLSVTATVTPPAGVTDPNPGDNSHTLTLPIVAPASGGGGAGSGGSAGTPSSSAALLSVSPNSIEQGVILSPQITFTGQGTSWRQGATTVSFGPGIALQGGLGVQSPTSLTAQISAFYSAAPGPRAITITTGSEVVTLPNALTIIPRTQPVITQISPNSASLGQKSVTVTLTGVGTRWTQGQTVFTPPPGITPTRSEIVNSPTSMTVTFDIHPSAAPGPRDFIVSNSGPVVASDVITVSGGFTLLPAPQPADLGVSTGVAGLYVRPGQAFSVSSNVARNQGPGAADGAIITIPASPGMTKTGVSCSGQNGAQVGNPTVAQIESGFVIAALPAGSFVSCTISGSVTGAAGTAVLITVNVKPPSGVSDPNPGNNSVTDPVPII